jgi:DNA-directed RNA polymerase specialized sigma24 family protein
VKVQTTTKAARVKEAGRNEVMTREALHKLFSFENLPGWMMARLEKKLRSRPDARDAAKDILHEVLIQASHTRRKYIGKPRNWVLNNLIWSALSEAKTFLGLHANDRTDRFPDIDGQTFYDLPELWPSRRAYGAITAFERLIDIRMALKRLSPQQQHIARLVGQGYSYEDIGGLMREKSKSDVHRRWDEISLLLAARLEIPAKNIKRVLIRAAESE